MSVIIFFMAAFLLIFTSLLMGEGLPHSSWDNVTLAAILGAGIFNVLSLLFTNYGFQKVEAVIAGNILTLETIFAVILGLLLYQEIPNVKELIGGLLIVISVYQINKLT